LGCDYNDTHSRKACKAGTIGHIGCTSFFPSKNLGCYGDGGAVLTNDNNLAERIHILAHHGSEKKYFHKEIGLNSRLDTLQAAILNTKLPHLDSWNKARKDVAKKYNSQLSKIKEIVCPKILPHKTHIFHQYTLTLQDAKTRNELQEYLISNGVATAIYYPVPLNEQEVYRKISKYADACPITKKLSDTVLSLPVFPELTDEKIIFITDKIKRFFQIS
jgi:dTDP-4-amino-4,6-dideoxygalactose transaminase